MATKIGGSSLPPKEAGLFKKLVKSYEQKQYKAVLKIAKQIMSNPKFAEHGETLAMKGLTLNGLGKKEEAYECVKRGLKNALMSHICWHVYGLLQRSDHKYDEAIKCYRNALKWDKDNLQILRDLSLLQIQMRDLEGYQETRYQLFKLRATQRASWIGFAMSYHLLNDPKTAANILDEFRKTANQSNGMNDESSAMQQYEISEQTLYQVMLYTEASMFEKALEHLEENQKIICDKLSYLETKADLLLKLNRHDEAITLLEERLIARNSENRGYYQLLEKALQIENDENARLELYARMQKTYPRSAVLRRLPLKIVSNENDFKPLVDAYMRRDLRKGAPALFRDLKPLYETPFKSRVIEELVQQYLKNLLHHLSFDDASESTASEDVCTLVWVRYYLAQHYSYFGRQEEALEQVDQALLHTPTLIELYVLRGKIQKRRGELEDAVLCLEEAQSLDTADRYLNSKCAKYMLRANAIENAEAMCGKFTREGSDPAENLNEMQCMWFQNEASAAYYRLGKLGEALKKCVEIERHFAEMQEDQFDFHTYCMRKMTLRAYVALIRLEDGLKSHPFYFSAAQLAIRIYLQLYDNPLPEPEELIEKASQPVQNGHLSKKNKRERAKERAEKEKAEKEKVEKKSDKDTDSFASTLHKEPLIPRDLERPKDPLAEAQRFLKPLQLLARNRIETHLLSFDLYLRKEKILLMLQSLKRASQIDAHNSKFLEQIKQFEQFYTSKQSEMNENVITVIQSELAKINKKVHSGMNGLDSKIGDLRLNV